MSRLSKLFGIASIVTALAAVGIASAQTANDDLETCKGYVVDEECLSESDLVKQVQTALNAAGCEVGAVDGVIGRRTRGWLKVHDKIWNDVSFEELFDQKRGDDIITRVNLISIMVCSRAYQMSEECEAAYDKWKKTRGAGAFAVSGLGGCASASGYGSISSARSAVLARCSKNGTSCRIHDTRAPSKAQKGSSNGTSSGGCSASSNRYRQFESPKALVRGSKGCYVAYGGSTVGKARLRALAYCRRKGSTGCKVVSSQ